MQMKTMPDVAIDYLVLNAGVLKYPNVRPLEQAALTRADNNLQRATEICNFSPAAPTSSLC